MKLNELLDLLIPRANIGGGIIGISGAQGAGKSTLCNALATRLRGVGTSVAVISLDDVYLGRISRRALAASVHHLCAVRGVPGTHDISLLMQTVRSLQSSAPTPLPQFSKADDDLLPRSAWPVFEGRADVILLEGWCVGALPDDLPPTPVNELEAQQDSDGTWKAWSRTAAHSYAPLWDMLDQIWMLVPPDFDAVIDARWQQEQKLLLDTGACQFESRQAVASFCAHYEGWTRGLWQQLPARADLVLDRDRNFNFAIRPIS